MAGITLKLEGARDATLQRWFAMEDAMERRLDAVSITMNEAPAAAIAQFVPLDGHGESAWPHPLREQFWIGVGAVDQFARRAELACDHDPLCPWFCRDLGFCRLVRRRHGAVPFCCVTAEMTSCCLTL